MAKVKNLFSFLILITICLNIECNSETAQDQNITEKDADVEIRYLDSEITAKDSEADHEAEVPKPCLDKDSDGFGIGEGCLGLDCDDNNENIHQVLNYCTYDGNSCGNYYNQLCLKECPNPCGESICWNKTFQGRTDHNDFASAYSIQQTTDNGYIVAGRMTLQEDDFGNGWIFKLDENGNMEWEKIFGGSSYDYLKSIQQTKDGGYIAAGSIYPENATIDDAWILKLDPDGNLEWDKTFGEGFSDQAHSIQQTVDEGYIIAGYKGTNDPDVGSQAWILKLDSNGNLEWDKAFSENDDYNFAFSIQQTKDLGYIVAGETSSIIDGTSDAWVFKLDENGNLDWRKMFGNNDWDRALSIKQTKDQEYIITGTKGGIAWVFKLDSIGNQIWETTFDGKYEGGAASIELTNDNGYIIGGGVCIMGGHYYNGWVLKLDESGNIKWDKIYGYNYCAQSVQQTADNGYIIAGTMGASDAAVWAHTLIIKLIENGNSVCE